MASRPDRLGPRNGRGKNRGEITADILNELGIGIDILSVVVALIRSHGNRPRIISASAHLPRIYTPDAYHLPLPLWGLLEYVYTCYLCLDIN